MTLDRIPYSIPIGKYRCHCLYLVDNKSKEDWHVYSFIEKLEPDMKECEDSILTDRASGSGKNKYKMCVVRCDIEVTDEFTKNPINQLRMDNGRDVIIPKFFNKAFSIEPEGKAYMIAPNNSSSGLGRIMPLRHGPAFIKTYIDQERKVLDLIQSEDYLQKQLSELSQKVFGLDLWNLKEHIGNCYLVWHNPIFKDFHIKASNNPNGIIVDIIYRSLENAPFQLRYQDLHQQDYAIADFLWNIPAGVRSIFIPTEEFPKRTSISIYSEEGNLLFYTQPTNFITQLDLHIGVCEKSVAVTIEESNGRKHTLPPVNKYKYVDDFIGSKRENASTYFSDNEIFHQVKEQEKSREFIFFNGSKTEEEKNANKKKAREAVIDLLNRAKKVCYICDPYFNEKDFLEFAVQANSLDVKIRIINSKADVGISNLKQLRNDIRKYNEHIQIEDYIMCRVLKGGDSRLHDRFIVADDNVWYVGSSFSEFGARACSLAKLSRSASLSVKTYVEEWWNSDSDTEAIENI